jgi:hypothetical protein
MIILFWVISAYGKSALLVLTSPVYRVIYSRVGFESSCFTLRALLELNLYIIYHTHHDDAPKTEGIHDQPHLVP